MVCLHTALWSKENSEHCHLGSNHMLCVCVGNMGLLCLLENGKSDKRSHRVTSHLPECSCRQRYNYSSSGFFSEVNPRDNNIPV